MKHKINNQEVEIQWVQGDLLESIDAHSKEYAVTGKGDNGKMYGASAVFVDGDLDEVYEETIEEILN